MSSCLIAIPGFQPSRGVKKPIFRYANGSPDLNRFEELSWLIKFYETLLNCITIYKI